MTDHPQPIWLVGNAKDGGTVYFPPGDYPSPFKMPELGLEMNYFKGGGTVTWTPPKEAGR